MKSKLHKSQEISSRIYNVMWLYLSLAIISACIIGFSTFHIVKYLKAIPFAEIILPAVAFILLTLMLQFTFTRLKKVMDKVINDYVQKNSRYESILDAVPYPIHATDKQMKWTYMNKAFEEILVKNKIINNRESAYGQECCKAGTTICNNENCGIRQLVENNCFQTDFEWFDANCKQSTSQINDRYGSSIGYVEVITDLTSIVRNDRYSEKEIKRLFKSLDLIASGNLDIDLEVTVADEYTNNTRLFYMQINDRMKKVVDSIRTLKEEAEKLAAAGLNGDLEVRGDESKVNGVYQMIIHGVNQTFDSIKEPLDVASAFITDLAEGIATAPVENCYQGYYGKLIENLNSVFASLTVLLHESNKLTAAGQNGELSVRGDLNMLKGNYADIVNGFNKTLDAIVAPLNESADVLGKFAYNDFSLEMSDGYQGMYQDFSKSINLVRSRFLSIQDALARISSGDLSKLDEFRKIGKRSENDQIMPTVIEAYQIISDLINETNRLAQAAYEGNLDMRGNIDRFSGGYRQIIDGLNRTMEAVDAPIEESSNVLRELAQGNLTVAMMGEYKGMYNQIKTSLNHTIDSFNVLISEIFDATNQVATGSKQVSEGSQLLSQGATEQASALEELSASITEVSSQTKQNAEFAVKANSLASKTNSEAVHGTEKMDQMLLSMKEINESSTNISKINKVIDDIAFQTNILALNAAVEAARAGQYGKGFAVVAEEVRNLAAKSADAARETTALIERSMSKVQTGSQIAEETATSLSNISESVQKVTELVGNIANASNEQATSIAQINQGLSQVSSVVQTNSATAEESAASSEELSGQAVYLSELVGKFNLQQLNK